MGAKNKVLAGDYEGCFINGMFGQLHIPISMKAMIDLNKDTVEAYEVITEESRKSAVSGVARGAVGAALLGPVGLLAGLSAKSKGAHTVAIKFKDGKNSLIEMDDKLYKLLMKTMF